MNTSRFHIAVLLFCIAFIATPYAYPGGNNELSSVCNKLAQTLENALLEGNHEKAYNAYLSLNDLNKQQSKKVIYKLIEKVLTPPYRTPEELYKVSAIREESEFEQKYGSYLGSLLYQKKYVSDPFELSPLEEREFYNVFANPVVQKYYKKKKDIFPVLTLLDHACERNYEKSTLELASRVDRMLKEEIENNYIQEITLIRNAKSLPLQVSNSSNTQSRPS